jgi:putative transposase
VQIYRTTSHTKYDLKYHLVWITKYRRAVLSGVVGARVRELVREICKANDIEIVKGHVGKEHVHLFVSMPPYLSVSKVMQYLKGKTSHKLLMEFAHLRRQFWGRHLWAGGYFAASSGNVTDEVIVQYIATQGQEPSEADDDFKRISFIGSLAVFRRKGTHRL